MELQCESCDKGFSSNTALYKHKYTAHLNSLDKDCNNVYSAKKSKISKSGGKLIVEKHQKNEKIEKAMEKEDNMEYDADKSIKNSSDDYLQLSSNANNKCRNEDGKSTELEKNDLKQVMRGVYETQLFQKLKKEVSELRDNHESEIIRNQNNYDKILKELKRRGKKSTDQMSEGEMYTGSGDGEMMEYDKISKYIFNHKTMNEIYRIQKLMEGGQINEIITKHHTTFKNILLGITSGVIPLCQPQRDKVTDNQRELVYKLQYTTKNSALKILKGKHTEIIKLFVIVKDSFHFIRESFNK